MRQALVVNNSDKGKWTITTEENQTRVTNAWMFGLELTVMAPPANSIGIVMHANHGIAITIATMDDNPVANIEMAIEINEGTCWSIWSISMQI